MPPGLSHVVMGEVAPGGGLGAGTWGSAWETRWRRPGKEGALQPLRRLWGLPMARLQRLGAEGSSSGLREHSLVSEARPELFESCGTTEGATDGCLVTGSGVLTRPRVI